MPTLRDRDSRGRSHRCRYGDSPGLPGVRVLHQRQDVWREVPRGHISKGHVVEHPSKRSAHCDPHFLQVLGRAGVDGVLGPLPSYLGQGADERSDDVSDGDVRGISRQAVSAIGPPLADHEPSSAQVVHDRPEESSREVLLGSEGLGGLRCPGRGQGEQCSDSVVSGCGDVHV